MTDRRDDAAPGAGSTEEGTAGSAGTGAEGTDGVVPDGTGSPVSTGCGSIDDLLGGGLERGVVTQVYGPPAAGKTNLALSAAVEVAATGGTALYVDTEGLSADRFGQLLAARTDDQAAAAERVVVSSALDFDEQEEAVRDATELAPRADLVVLDSATGFYRLERGNDDGETLRAVGRQVTHLLSLARRHDLAVLLTNQVYADPESESATAKPLGGHTLEHWTATVLRLDRFRGGRRRATLRKHRSKAAGETAEFRITDAGIESAERR
ncbi:MAG: DNA repair and recombination protein RadB [Halobacteriaceae archaeon]